MSNSANAHALPAIPTMLSVPSTGGGTRFEASLSEDEQQQNAIASSTSDGHQTSPCTSIRAHAIASDQSTCTLRTKFDHLPTWLNLVNIIVAITCAVIAYVALVYSHTATDIEEWTSKKDYIEFCSTTVSIIIRSIEHL
jgi:hypothetical protein